jgi:hypothetical protein
MNSSRHNEVAAEPRQFKVGMKVCRIDLSRRLVSPKSDEGGSEAKAEAQSTQVGSCLRG